MIWTTKDGRDIPVNMMTTLHIENSLRMLERRVLPAAWERHWSLFKALSCVQGDMAREAAEREVESDGELDHWLGLQQAMKTELKMRRKS